MGKDFLSYAVALEEISRADAGVGMFLSVHSSAATSPLHDWGSDELKKKYMPLLASGEKLGAFVFTETNVGSDAGGTETTAVLDGDEYVINGEKIYITNAPYADIYTVFAVTTPGIGTKGISAFIVEKGTPGFEFKTVYSKMGLKSSSTAQLVFKDVRAPKENMVGPEGKGFNIAMTTLNGGRIGIASQSLGIAQRALEEAVDQAKNRYQFGTPIGANQAVANKIADMATRVRAARLMTYSAAMMKDAKADFLQAVAMAKLFSSETAGYVVVEAIIENVEIKAAVIKQLNEILRDDVIFATNTSSLPITELASNYKKPENYIGMHFFNPVPVMSLVEIIRGIATSDQTYKAIHDLTLKINKFPVMVNDVPGFVSNRVLQVMINEAISCVEHGVPSVEGIDEVMKRGMAHPMGPLELADFIGLDTVLSILEVMYKGYGNPKYAPSPLLRSYVKAGWLGKKSGKGFYDYSK